jgi:hypothetical protein
MKLKNEDLIGKKKYEVYGCEDLMVAQEKDEVED